MKVSRLHYSGFTLIELLVALILAGLLITAGVPMISGVFNNFTAASTADDLVNALAYAREQAIFERQEITVCSGDNTCTGTWNDGWRVFITATNETLRIVDQTANNANIIAGAVDSVIFDGDGESATAATFQVCSDSGDANAHITLRLLGAGYVNKSTGAGGC